MAPPRGFEADVQSLVASFVSQHGATASFEGFKSVWRSYSFSLIHEARPQTLTDEQYTQALYAAAVALLGRGGGAGAASGVDANDAGVLYALLLLFRTQYCTPRLHVYLPMSKVEPLQRLLRQAVDARHGDVLRVMRVLLAEDALVLGSVAQTSAADASAPMLRDARPMLPAVAAAEEHLLTPLDASLRDSLTAVAAQYADAARACGLECGSPLQAAMQACADAVDASQHELAPSGAATRGDDLRAVELRHAAVGPTAGAIAARSAALPLHEGGVDSRAQLDAQLAQLAAGADAAGDTHMHMPSIPGI